MPVKETAKILSQPSCCELRLGTVGPGTRAVGYGRALWVEVKVSPREHSG